MLLEPLRQWFCDRCGGLIDDPEYGALVWFEDGRDGTGQNHSFRIFHKPYKSPSFPARPNGCFPDEQCSDVSLSEMVRVNGLNTLLSMLDRGKHLDPEGTYLNKVRDVRDWVEVVRRLNARYYEQARGYLAQAKADGVLQLEGQEFLDELELMRIIEHYSGEKFPPGAHDVAFARFRGTTSS